MKKSMAVTFLVLVACLFQQNAKSKQLKVVDSGDTVTFTVQLDATPQFSGGRVSVLVGPTNGNLPGDITNNGQYSRAAGTDTIANQSTYNVSVQIPGDAPDGVWEALFSYALPNGSLAPLEQGRQLFRVKHKKFSGVPRSATTEIQ